MRKYLFMLLLCSLTVSAQDVRSDFQSFRQGTLEGYSGFRKSVLDEYAKYLQGVWDEYEQFCGAKRDNQPKPSVAPKAETEPQSVTPKPIEPEVSPSVLPEPAAPVVPKPVVPSRSSDLPVTFYGMKVKAVACKARTLGNGGRNEVASVWEAYQKDSSMKDAVASLQSLSMALGLNDWFTFELIRAYAKTVCQLADDRVVMRHFLLVNMGYDVRLAVCGQRLMLLVPFVQQVYERAYLRIDGRTYYAFSDEETDDTGNASVYTCRLPADADHGRALDLTIQGGRLGIKTGARHSFSLTDGVLTLRGEVDKGTMEALRHYPQTGIPCYAMSDVDRNFRSSLLEQIGEQLKGCSETEAVGRILRFVQFAFCYATDGEQHGYEKPYFVEENFYYPKNDCEDRAILFAFLVRNLLRLDVHLVRYPGHECAAVHFTDPTVDGDKYTLDGKTFLICDPTYIGASIGQCMPNFRNVKPVVERWY